MMAEPPDPGSPDAIALGCVCSSERVELEDGRKVFYPDQDCPVHGLAAVMEQLAASEIED